MNKTEAIYTSVLVGWVCGFDKPSGGPYSVEQAKTAAVTLAGRVHTALHAGPGRDRVAAAFDTRPSRAAAFGAIVAAIIDDDMGDPASLAESALIALESLGVTFERPEGG